MKALAVMDHLARAPEPVGVTEIAKAVGIPKATAHRLLATLHAADAAAYDAVSQRYSLGPSIVRYGLMGLRRLELHRVARPVLEQVQRETGETAVLAIRQGSTKVFLDQVESQQQIRQTMVLGERLHLFHGAGGQAILASLDSADLDEYLATGPFPRISDLSITEPDQLVAELELVRKRGYAFARGERAASIGAPIFDHLGRVVGSVVACGPGFRFTADRIPRLAKVVTAAAMRVSLGLGYSEKDE